MESFGEKRAITLYNSLISGKHFFMYPWSNENLDVLFKIIDVKDKDVLSVMSSGDQPLLCHYHGAKHVDTFDINYDALFLFILRKWLIENTDRRILSRKTFGAGDPELGELMKKIIPQNIDEEDAYSYWKTLIRKFDEISLYGKTYRLDKRMFDLPEHEYDWLLPFSLELKKDIRRINFKFYNINFFKELNLNNKYDVIILSNILEHSKSRDDWCIAKKNILDLLNPNGVAVCTNKIFRYGDSWHRNEVKLLTDNSKSDLEYLQVEEFKTIVDDENGYIPIGYQYRKIKK